MLKKQKKRERRNIATTLMLDAQGTTAEHRRKWQAGDIVIWDNRCTVHSAAGGYPSSERRIHWRTTVMQ
jgi:alpha-ketoglutarate-dependent taurine dioxygenase